MCRRLGLLVRHECAADLLRSTSFRSGNSARPHQFDGGSLAGKDWMPHSSTRSSKSRASEAPRRLAGSSPTTMTTREIDGDIGARTSLCRYMTRASFQLHTRLIASRHTLGAVPMSILPAGAMKRSGVRWKGFGASPCRPSARPNESRLPGAGGRGHRSRARDQTLGGSERRGQSSSRAPRTAACKANLWSGRAGLYPVRLVIFAKR
jgi:hypothetical protein